MKVVVQTDTLGVTDARTYSRYLLGIVRLAGRCCTTLISH